MRDSWLVLKMSTTPTPGHTAIDVAPAPAAAAARSRDVDVGWEGRSKRGRIAMLSAAPADAGAAPPGSQGVRVALVKFSDPSHAYLAYLEAGDKISRKC